METYLCSTEPDPEKREDPIQLASVEMSGRWTRHAYTISHDRQNALLFIRRNGIMIRRGDTSLRFYTDFNMAQGGTYWSPDSKRVTFWVMTPEGKGVGVLDVRKLTSEMEDGPPPYDVAYVSPKGYAAFGLEWSPGNKVFYVIEHFREDFALYSRIVRVPVGAGKPEELMRIGGRVDFFMPPVSRFENGDGPSAKSYEIVFGHPRGLYLLDPKKGDVRRIAQLPANGLHNIEWNPRRDEFTMFFKRAMTNGEGKRFFGVYRVDLAAIKKNAELDDYCEELYGRSDVHTLWYSPRGTYISWATDDAIYYRKPKAPPEETVQITASHEDLELEIKGVSWHPGEKKLAYTAGNHVFIYDLARAESLRVATFGKEVTHFTAEPIWRKNRVFLSVFQDLGGRSKDRGRVKVTMPEDEEEKKAAESGPEAKKAK